MEFALRAIWVLSPFDTLPIFERRFNTVESRARRLPNYVTLPESTIFCEAVLVATGIRKCDVFVESRDGCDQPCWAPAFELPTPSGTLAPVVVLQHRGLLLCGLPLADWSKENEQSSFFNVAQAMDSLSLLSEQLNGDISQKSTVQSLLQRFVSIALPFGQPICHTAMLAEQIFNAGTKEQAIDKIKQPVWNPTISKGKSQLSFHITEQVHCQMPCRDGNNKSMISGTVWLTAGEIAGSSPEISISLSHPLKISNLTLAPQAQTTVQSDEATTVQFNPAQASRTVLCHYTIFNVPLPVEATLTIQKSAEGQPSILQLMVQPTKAALTKLDITLGCTSKSSMKLLKFSMGAAVESDSFVRWDLPVSKLKTRAATLEATVSPQHVEYSAERDMEAHGVSASLVPMQQRRPSPLFFLLLLVLVLTFCCYTPVAGIKCVQCASENTEDCINKPPAPKECDVSSRFCIVVKETLPYNGSIMTMTRTCSPVDLGSKCHDSFSFSGANVLVCYEACGLDGCNAVPHVITPPSSKVSKSSASSLPQAISIAVSMCFLVLLIH